MYRPVHPYIAFGSLILVALIAGIIIWSSNSQLTPSATFSPSPQTSVLVSNPTSSLTGSKVAHSPQPSTVVSSPTASPVATEWQHYVNKTIGFQMDIPTHVGVFNCKTIIPLKLSDNNGHVSIYEEYSRNNHCIVNTTRVGIELAEVWVGKATSFEQLQQFYQKAVGNPKCQLNKEEWLTYSPQYKNTNDGYGIDGSTGCTYNGVIYFKKAGMVIYHTLPYKSAQTFFNPLNISDQSYDDKFIGSIKPLAE